MAVRRGKTEEGNTAAYAAGLLATGTTLAVYGQFITNASVTRPSSHVIAWTKYAVSFLTSTFMSPHRAAPGKPADNHPHPSIQTGRGKRTAELLATVIGLLDVVAYALSCFGFPLCGSALTMVVFAASGQIFTATMRALILRRPLTARQQQAVAVVTIGLVIRASPWKLLDGSGPLSSSSSSSVLLGVACTVASAALYSLIGVLYEKLFSLPQNHLTHVQVNQRISLVGLLAATAYQVLYTWPRRQQLVIQPWASSGLSAAHAVLLHAGFGLVFTLHSYMQGQVLCSSGAMAVGIVNAMRAATVTAASAMLFCSPKSPQQCLSTISATSALTITTGVLWWVTAAQSTPEATLPAGTAVVRHPKKD